MYVYTTTTKIVFLVVIEHFSLFCRLSFLYDFKGVFDMVEKKTDRRILKTKRALRESLLYLLKEQPIQKISVSRLCEKSDINRSTFYTYYSSPMDLLESIEDEILNTLEEDMIQFEKENSISQLMNSIIFYISEHKQLVRLLFSDHGDPGFQNKLLLATQHDISGTSDRDCNYFKINFCLPPNTGPCQCGRAAGLITMRRLCLLCIFIL